MPGFWGADSVALLDTSTNGTTLANYVINTYFAGTPHDEIVFWGRYFDIGQDMSALYAGDAEGNALRNAVHGYNNPVGGRSWILPIAAPYYGNGVGQNGTYAQGVYSGQYVCQHIIAKLSSRLMMPGSEILYIYVDLEYTTNQNFVSGWADGVNGYSYNGGVPFYASFYSSPTAPNEKYFVSSAGYARYWVSWSTEPEPLCSGCYSPGPTWGPDAIGTYTTFAWQYGEAGANNCDSCRSNFPCDLDQTDPSVSGPYGYGVCDYMLYIGI
jgi:hypothetical protein